MDLIIGYFPHAPLRVLHNVWYIDHVIFVNSEFQNLSGLKDFMEEVTDLC